MKIHWRKNPLLTSGNSGYEEVSHSYCWDQTFVQETSGVDGFGTLIDVEDACDANANCEMIYACQAGNCGFFLCSYESQEAYSSLSSIYKKKNK